MHGVAEIVLYSRTCSEPCTDDLYYTYTIRPFVLRVYLLLTMASASCRSSHIRAKSTASRRPLYGGSEGEGYRVRAGGLGVRAIARV